MSKRIVLALVSVMPTTVLEDHYNPRLIKELLQDLSSTLHTLTKGMGKCVLVGSVNVWLCRLDVIHTWQQQLNNLHIPKVRALLGLRARRWCWGSETLVPSF